MESQTEIPVVANIKEVAKLTAELRKKVQEIPTSLASPEQFSKIRMVEHGVLRFQRDLCELAQAFGIKAEKDFWWPQ